MKFQVSQKTKKGNRVLYAVYANRRDVVRKSVDTKSVQNFLIELLQEEIKNEEKIIRKSEDQAKNGSHRDSFHHQVAGDIIDSFKTRFTKDRKVEVIPGSVVLAKGYLPEDDDAPQRVAQILDEAGKCINAYYSNMGDVYASMNTAKINEFEIQYDVVDGIPRWNKAFLIDKDKKPYTKDTISKDRLVKLLVQIGERTQISKETKRLISLVRSVTYEGLAITKLICNGSNQGFQFKIPEHNPEITQILDEISKFFPINPFAGMDEKEIKEYENHCSKE